MASGMASFDDVRGAQLIFKLHQKCQNPPAFDASRNKVIKVPLLAFLRVDHEFSW